MDLDIMDYQPIVVYLNGEYYGLYDLREKICEAYVANRTGVSESTIDMIKGNNMVMAGGYESHKELLQYVESHDLTVAEHYNYVCSQV
ncbi:CotH kinase family protein, partial [Klebsiella pneumoniae]|uniref:CotH kinase family protein n=1 Tax=Klebsiella pneumoniae TaxID=573 RepID=UPI0025A2C83D